MMKKFLMYVLLFSLIFVLAYIFTGIVCTAVMKNYKEPVGYQYTKLKVKPLPAYVVSVSDFGAPVAGLKVKDENMYITGFNEAIQPAVSPMGL